MFQRMTKNPASRGPGSDGKKCACEILQGLEEAVAADNISLAIRRMSEYQALSGKHIRAIAAS